MGGGARVYKSDGCGTIIKVDDYGKVDVFTGSSDIGQGSETIIAQIVAEVLGVSIDDINVINNDTDVCPWDVGAHASRTTFVAGNSALGAAMKIKEQIMEAARRRLSTRTHPGSRLQARPDIRQARQGEEHRPRQGAAERPLYGGREDADGGVLLRPAE